jgi:hypothetical protein
MTPEQKREARNKRNRQTRKEREYQKALWKFIENHRDQGECSACNPDYDFAEIKRKMSPEMLQSYKTEYEEDKKERISQIRSRSGSKGGTVTQENNRKNRLPSPEQRISEAKLKQSEAELKQQRSTTEATVKRE